MQLMISFSSVALTWGTANIGSVSIREGVGRSIGTEAIDKAIDKALHERCSDDREEKKMSANLNQGSAKIYQFPAGGRAALGGRRYGDDKQAADLAASPIAGAAACSESWYHEAAIQEAKPTCKPTWEQ
jgi:hypothetical protein